MIRVLRYQREDGVEPYTAWFRKLRDAKAKQSIASRLRRLEAGNFGDCKFVGEGVCELRVDVGPGYRIYYGVQGGLAVILFCGGDKRTQSADIARAKALLSEWRRRQK